MSVRTLEAINGHAVIYDSVTNTAFGPIFDSIYEAGAFLKWLKCDARSLAEGDLQGSVYIFKSIVRKMMEVGSFNHIVELYDILHTHPHLFRTIDDVSITNLQSVRQEKEE